MNLFSLGSLTWLWETFNGLMLIIVDMIYRLIGLLYQVFYLISQVNLFDRSTFSQITKNMYVVMGIAMLFIFAYNIVLMIINPDDKKSTGSTTKVVKETIISLVLVILLPTIFNWMYVFQNNIINSGIISSIVLNNVSSNSNIDTSCDYSKYGFDSYATKDGTNSQATTQIQDACNKFIVNSAKFPSLEGAYMVAPTVLSAFYRPTNFTLDECTDFMNGGNTSGSFGTGDEDKQICLNYYYDIEYSKLTGSTSVFTSDKYLRNIVSDDSKEGMELNWLMAIIAGVVAIIMYFAYCIEIGVRVAKLGVLQIVSPIAVMLRIIPKQKEAFFDKWFKQVKNTYLDVFIRLLIINFALFAISLVPKMVKTLFSSFGDMGDNGLARAFAVVFLILGILQFGKECPDLIKEFFGSSGRFSIKGGLKKIKENPLTNATRASVYGATTGKGFGKVTGALSGAFRGGVGGYDKAVKGIDKMRTEQANGSTWYGRSLDRARMAIGMETVADADERRANREVEGKWHITERMKRNDEAMKNAKKIKSTVKGALNKEDTSQTYDVNGVTGNLYQLHKYEEGLYQAISGAKTDTEKAKAYQAYQQFQSKLVDVEKEAVNKVVNEALKAKTDTELSDLYKHYNINGGDVGTIQSAANAIVSEASKGALGVEYDKDGKEIAGTGWKENSIDDAASLKSLMSALGNESAQLAQHSQKDFGENYDRHVANRNVVKKQGSSEKK